MTATSAASPAPAESGEGWPQTLVIAMATYVLLYAVTTCLGTLA